ncbi:MAG: AbrB/MazE/SpoVT family DNA-binding domain-containing protein [Euryarchaeota archaeon]|nr:AbrB/MazE/SpoVT family DNA-binding domain-containing protein [Euryarchaeota archaeon]
MGVPATVRRWGSSLAVTLPKELVRSLSLREGEKIHIEVKKENPLREVFGKGKLDKPIDKVMREIDSELWGGL